jgi:hypothetical protein
MIISFIKLELYFASNLQKLNSYFTACCIGLFAESYYSRTSKYFSFLIWLYEV